MHAQTPIFDSTHTHVFTHRWLDGNILDERPINLRPATDAQVQRYLGQLVLEIPFNAQGNPTGDVNTPNALAAATELFDELCFATSDNDLPGSDGLADFPHDQKNAVLNATLFNLQAERPLFRRGDPAAPKPGETVIQLTCWFGEHRVSQDEEGAESEAYKPQVSTLEQRFVQTFLYFRTPKAADFDRWEQANDKHSFERNGKGQITLKRSRFDLQKIHETLFGSDLRQVQALFLRGENYAGSVPFYHVYYAATELLKKDQDLGKLSQRLNGRS